MLNPELNTLVKFLQVHSFHKTYPPSADKRVKHCLKNPLRAIHIFLYTVQVLKFHASHFFLMNRVEYQKRRLTRPSADTVAGRRQTKQTIIKRRSLY